MDFDANQQAAAQGGFVSLQREQHHLLPPSPQPIDSGSLPVSLPPIKGAPTDRTTSDSGRALPCELWSVSAGHAGRRPELLFFSRLCHCLCRRTASPLLSSSPAAALIFRLICSP